MWCRVCFRCVEVSCSVIIRVPCTATHCNALQHTSTSAIHLAGRRKRGTSAVLYCKERSLQRTSTHLHRMWHDALIYDTTHSYVTCRIHKRHDACIIDTLLLKTHTQATRESFMTHSQLWRGSFTCVTQLIATCVTSHSHVAPQDTHASYKRGCHDSSTSLT